MSQESGHDLAGGSTLRSPTKWQPSQPGIGPSLRLLWGGSASQLMWLLAAFSSLQVVGLRASVNHGLPSVPCHVSLSRWQPPRLKPFRERVHRESLRARGKSQSYIITIVACHHLCCIPSLRIVLLTLKGRRLHKNMDNPCVRGGRGAI